MILGPTQVRPLANSIRADEIPLATTHQPERRSEPRYMRCWLGILNVGAADFSAACVDVSRSGAQFVVPERPNLAPGTQVRVRVADLLQEYTGTYTVVSTSLLQTGTAVHLSAS